MTIQDLGSMGELIAAIATVATLIYLAKQLQANTKATQASNWHEITRDYARTNEILTIHAEIGEIWREGLKNYPNLPKGENERFATIIANQGLQFQALYAQYQNGQLEEETYTAYLRFFCSLIAQEGGQHWWEESARPVYVPSMVAAVDAHLATGEYPNLMPEMGANTHKGDLQ